MKYYSKWSVCHLSDINKPASGFIPAVVPGAVHLDWAKATGMPDVNIGENYRLYRWMEDSFWLYRVETPPPILKDDQRLFFISKGIDYEFEIRINGEILLKQEGMYRHVSLDLTEKYREGDIFEIMIYPAPKRPGSKPDDRSEADHSCKMTSAYGWDWEPHLVPLGIWDETYFEVRPALHISDAELIYSLSDDLTCAMLEMRTTICGSGTVKWSLWDQDNNVVYSGENTEFILNNPRLWWCAGQGEQHMYRWLAELRNSMGDITDSVEGRTGIRLISLSMNQGAWDEPRSFPMTRSVPPMTLTLNGRKIFGKGSNWVNPEIFIGTITGDTYRTLLTYAVESNMNILRVWGGGIVNKESFFDICDELGLMVWQEFPLACNKYPDDENYLAVLDAESKAIIRRVRRHASHVLWCGGNELFNNWSGMTDQSLPLRLLNKNCYELDRNKPFIPTSPIMGVGHGCYVFRYPDGRDVFEVMSKSRFTAYCEFGVPSTASVELLNQIIPEGELFPPSESGSWLAHHAFGAWMEGTWLCLPIIEYYFGKAENIEQIVYYSQLLQSEGYKAIFEESRRQWPYCSMAVNWCYNEPWITAANNSLLQYPASPKPALGEVRNALRPAMFSATIPRFDWKPGGMITVTLWFLNDSPKDVFAGTAEAWLDFGGQRVCMGKWDAGTVKSGENKKGVELTALIPVDYNGLFELSVTAVNAEFSSSYRLLVK